MDSVKQGRMVSTLVSTLGFYLDATLEVYIALSRHTLGGYGAFCGSVLKFLVPVACAKCEHLQLYSLSAQITTSKACVEFVSWFPVIYTFVSNYAGHSPTIISRD